MMDWLDHYTAIESFLKGLVFWVKSLPNWGMASVIAIFSGISSRLGIIADIACGIIVWNVFGMPWGLFFFGVSLICWLIAIGLAVID